MADAGSDAVRWSDGVLAEGADVGAAVGINLPARTRNATAVQDG
jgi:hypothetical protein